MAKLNNTYDIVKAFDAIEDELIASMIRNMERHKLKEVSEDKQWTMWQAEQLKALEKYRRSNQKKFGTEFKKINSKIKALIKTAKDEGEMDQEIAILEAIRNGFKGHKISSEMSAEFFKLNERKLDALIRAVSNDMKKAETAILRRANDQYRKIIYNAQVYANTGAGTYEKAVDMATKDMLASGLNCVEYANGARHRLTDYADMAIRTASKRAYLLGEGTKRQEWGISTVIVNKRGNPCPKCLPFCGKVLIDDVWSGGTASDGPYPLMSKAIEYGLYHPRCKDSHTTYFPGISTADDTWTEKELADIELKTKQEVKQQYAKRQEEKYRRLEKFSLDDENKKLYRQKTGEYAADKGAYARKQFVDVTDKLLRNIDSNDFSIEELIEFTIDGIAYSVDGINVMHNNSEREIKVGKILGNVFGTKVQLVPEVKGKYKNVSTSDYYIDGEKWDLKELKGESKDAIRNSISKKKKQADNFVIDITEYKLDIEDVQKQAEYVFKASNTKFVKSLIIIRDEKVLRILKRI